MDQPLEELRTEALAVDVVTEMGRERGTAPMRVTRPE